MTVPDTILNPAFALSVGGRFKRGVFGYQISSSRRRGFL